MGQVNDNLHIGGQLSYATILPTAKSIPAWGVVHRFAVHDSQAPGTDVVDKTSTIHTFAFAGKVTGIIVTPVVAPNGGDKQFTIDLKRGNQGGAFATLLTTPTVCGDAHADRQAIAGVLTSSPTVCSAGDTLQIVWDASGSTGSQGQGAVVTVFIEEEPS